MDCSEDDPTVRQVSAIEDKPVFTDILPPAAVRPLSLPIAQKRTRISLGVDGRIWDFAAVHGPDGEWQVRPKVDVGVRG